MTLAQDHNPDLNQQLSPERAESLGAAEFDTQPLPVTEVETKKPMGRIKKAAIGAGLVLSGAVAALGISSVSGGDEKADTTPTTLTTPNNPGANQDSGATPETNGNAATPETDKTTGNVHAGTLLPGEKYITATLLNGEEIKVPLLRSPDDPERFMDSVFALTACYVSTGSEECLQQFGPEAQKTLRKIREEDFNLRARVSDNPDIQLAIFDDPNNPAEYTKGHDDKEGVDYVKLKTGDVYLNVFEGTGGRGSTTAWQAPETHTRQSKMISRASSLVVIYDKSPSGSLQVANFVYSKGSVPQK